MATPVAGLIVMRSLRTAQLNRARAAARWLSTVLGDLPAARSASFHLTTSVLLKRVGLRAGRWQYRPGLHRSWARHLSPGQSGPNWGPLGLPLRRPWCDALLEFRGLDFLRVI